MGAITGTASNLERQRADVRMPRRPSPLARVPEVDAHLASLLDPTSFAAEQYRVLRHQLEQLKRAGGLCVVGITSPAVGDGKTTTAINLAGALAQAPGARVLIVDADLRRPNVGQRLGLNGAAGPGLVGAIVDSGLGLETVARHRSPFNLSVVPAGAADESPFELLRSNRLSDLLAEARQRYDFVIVDAPPALLVPDCRVLERAVDGFLLVVGARKTPRKLLAETLSNMDPAKVIGIVFNDDDRPLGGYYKYYHAYYGNPHGRTRSMGVARGKARR